MTRSWRCTKRDEVLARSGIRIQGLKGEGVARVIGQVVQAVEDDLLAGAAVTVTDRRLALRRLPLLPQKDAGPANDETESS